MTSPSTPPSGDVSASATPPAPLQPQPQPQRSRLSRLLVPALFWLGLIGAGLALWLSGQAGEAWDTIRTAHTLPLVGVVLLGMLLPLLHALRWRVEMRALGIDVPAAAAADITVTSSLLNYASPGYLGAPAKAFLAQRTVGAPYTSSAVTMAFEQGLDFLVLVLASALVLLWLGPGMLDELSPTLDLSALQVVLLAGLAVLGLLAVVLVLRRAQRIVGRIRAAFSTLGKQVDRRQVALLTLLYWLAQVAVVGLLLYAVGLPAGLRETLALSTLPLLLGQIAPLPGGVGAREATMVALARPLAISSSPLLAMAVLQRVLLVAALPLALALVRLARRATPAPQAAVRS